MAIIRVLICMPINKKKLAIHLAWLGLMMLCGWYIFYFGKVVSDISQFMPHTSENQQLNHMLGELQHGSTSRFVLVRVRASTSEESAQKSRELKQYLENKPEYYTSVKNGDDEYDIDSFTSLYPYRFLLSSEHTYSENALRVALEERAHEISEGMGLVLKHTLTSDPQNQFIDYLTKISSRSQPNMLHDVWFDQAGLGAMLLVVLAGEGFDLDHQEQMLNYIRKYSDGVSNLEQFEISGPSVMAVETRASIQATMQLLSIVAVGLMVVLFIWGYRSISRLFIAAIPLITAILVAIVVTNMIFGDIHGIVLAFGITLLGVCLDLPLHLFSHLKINESPHTTLQSIWPTLRLSVFTTAFSYLALLGTDFSGLSQLAIFAMVGLISSLMVTRWVVPLWLKSTNEQLPLVSIQINDLSRYKTHIILICIVVPLIILIARADQLWSKDIASLSPVPESARMLDQKLRTQISAPEVSHMFYVQEAELEILLQRLERLSLSLNSAQQQGLFRQMFTVSDILPSVNTQRQRQQQLPDSQTLRKALDGAMSDLPFKREAFEAFIIDMEKSQTMQPLVWQDLQATPLAEVLSKDLYQRDGDWNATIRLSGISNVEKFDKWLLQNPEAGSLYVNLRSASSELMQEYQQTALTRLILGVLIIALVMFWISRTTGSTLRIVLPILLALLLTLGIQVAFGTELTLFHILALLLVVGMGLDYSLFFNRPVNNSQDLNMRTHGVMMSAGTTLSTFGVLAFADIPVLAAMGQTVSIGVLCCYMLSQMLAEPTRQITTV